MTDTTLIQRLQSAAHWHLTEGNGDDATHQALQDAAAALEQQAANLAYVKAASVFNLMEENKRQAAQIDALRADAERMTTALNKIAERQNSDWPDRCQALVSTARAAIRARSAV